MSDRESFEVGLRKDILKTGYPAEVLTAASLTARHWHCVLGPSYLDSNEGISREFDVRAYKELKTLKGDAPIVLGIYLLVECKKSEKPWVFFTAPSEIERHGELRYGDFIHAKTIAGVPLFSYGWMGEEPVIPHDEWLTFHHYATHQRWGHNYYEPFKKQEKTDRSVQIYTAIHSVVNATRHYVRNAHEEKRWVRIYYPLIVFDGEMFEARVVSKDNIEILPVDHMVLKYHSSSNERFDDLQGVDGRMALIDIVRISHIDKYCEQIEREQQGLYERLEIADRAGKLTPKENFN
jgi:hypothetical protein